MADTRIAGMSLGGILVIAGLVLAILLGHWWIGLIIIFVGLVFFGGFVKGSGTETLWLLLIGLAVGVVVCVATSGHVIFLR